MSKNKRVSRTIAALLSAVMLVSVTCSSVFTTNAAGTTVHSSILSPTTNYQTNPLGVDVDGIQFSWQMTSNLIGQGQCAYQIIVTKDAPDGETVWDSGKIFDSRSVGIDYGGKSLEWETQYFWSVTVTDTTGVELTSETASFETGCDWEQGGASWIMIPKDKMSDGHKDIPLFRTETTIPEGEIDSARLYVTALGTCDIYINGKEAMARGIDGQTVDDIFNPGWTDYNAYVNCTTYDVTELIDSTDIAIGAVIGRGWYKGKVARGNRFREVIGDSTASESAMCAKLEVTYADGSAATVVTDESGWKASRKTPFTNEGRNDSYSGESYSSVIAHEIEGWDKPNYQPFFDEGEDSDWFAVKNETYTGTMRATSVSASFFDPANDKKPVSGYKYSQINQSVENGGTSELPKGEVVEIPVDVSGEIPLKAGETLILDLGQNMVGVPCITVEGSQGALLTLRHAEVLNDGRINPTDSAGGSDGPKGTLYTANLRNAKCLDTDVLYGGVETYQPSQTFHGYRFTEISATGDIVVKAYTGKVITSVTDQTGRVETSDAAVNQLFSNILWGQRGNYLSVPTDCPQRDERSGWTGDAQVFSGTAVYNFNSMPFLLEYADIMNAHREAYGSFGLVMPTGWNKIGSGYDESNKSGWSDAGIIIPWNMYLQTGDISVLESQFDEMDAYMTQVGEKGGYDTGTYGDWLAFQAASVQFLNASYRAYTAQIMSKISTILGREDCVEKYDALFTETRRAAIDKYLTQDGDLLTSTADGVTEVVTSNQRYPVVDNAQSGLLWALKLGFYDTQQQRDAMVANLIKNIRNENGSMREGYAEDTLAVGFLGVNVILPVLTEIGAEDVAYKLLLQDEMPSWLYCVKNGATTIWERWNAYTSDNSFARKDMTSFNHYAYGAVGEWMYEHMAGIVSSETAPGFKGTILQPSVDSSGRITFVNGSYDSYYGTIQSSWTAENGALASYSAVIPANTTATLYLPVNKETVQGFAPVDGVSFAGMTERNGRAVAQFHLNSGGYDFAVTDAGLVVSLRQGYVSAPSSDKSILRTVIAYAQKQYDDPSFETVIQMVQLSFAAALTHAKEIESAPLASQEEIDAAWMALMTEIHKLGFVQGDISSLQQLITTAEGYDLDRYVDKGKAELLQAINDAKRLIEDKNSLQSEVRTMEDTLLQAMMNLRLKANKDYLAQVIAEANKIDTSSYTAESVERFSTAFAEATAILNDPEVSEEDQPAVDAAANSLQDAISSLVAAETQLGAPAPVGGDKTATVKGSAPKTGDSLPLSAASLLLLAGAADLALTKRR